MRIKRYDHTRIIITYSFSWKTQTKALPSYIPFPKKIETGFQVVTSRWLYMTFNTFNAYFQVSHFSLSFCCLYSHPFCSQISTEKKTMAMAPDTSKIIHPAQIQKIPLFSGGFAGKSWNDIWFSTHIIPYPHFKLLSFFRCFNLQPRFGRIQVPSNSHIVGASLAKPRSSSCSSQGAVIKLAGQLWSCATGAWASRRVASVGRWESPGSWKSMEKPQKKTWKKQE